MFLYSYCELINSITSFAKCIQKFVKITKHQNNTFSANLHRRAKHSRVTVAYHYILGHILRSHDIHMMTFVDVFVGLKGCFVLLFVKNDFLTCRRKRKVCNDTLKKEHTKNVSILLCSVDTIATEVVVIVLLSPETFNKMCSCCKSIFRIERFCTKIYANITAIRRQPIRMCLYCRFILRRIYFCWREKYL
jgi:hypothetical protein